MTKKAYLDANMLACMFIPNHQFQAPALKLFAELRVQKYKMYISPLGLDELWWTIYEKLGISGNPFNTSLPEFLNSWIKIKRFGILKLIQIKKPIEDGVDKALVLIEKYNLRPRDAFHLSTATSQGITDIVAKDRDINRVDLSQEGLNILTF